MKLHTPLRLALKTWIPIILLFATTGFSQETETKPETAAKKWDKVTFNRVNTTEKVVALTFDDGPLPKTTPRLLDILKENDVKATFFVLGDRIKWDKAILDRTVKEGHEIANHTITHPKITDISDWQLTKELEGANEVIKAATGKAPKFFRPPFGAFRKDQAQMIYNKYGMSTALWDVDPVDWKSPGSSVIADRLVNGAKPGSILLGHDIMPQTVEAIASVVPRLKAQGYKFVTLSELVTYHTEETETKTAE